MFKWHRYFSDSQDSCITHLLQPGVKNVVMKIGHKPNGGPIEKTHKISVNIMLSYWVSSSSRNRLRRPNGTQTLILYKVIFDWERGGSEVERRTTEREVGGSQTTSAVLCP